MTVHIIEMTAWGRANTDVSPRPWDGGRWGEIWNDGALSDGYPYLIGTFREKVQDEGGEDELRWFVGDYDGRDFSSSELTLESIVSELRRGPVRLSTAEETLTWAASAESNYRRPFQHQLVDDDVWRGACSCMPYPERTEYDDECIGFLVEAIRKTNTFFDGNGCLWNPEHLQVPILEEIHAALEDPDAPPGIKSWWEDDAEHQPLVRDWYERAHPGDPARLFISDTATFDDLQAALDAEKDVYEVIGVHNSVVRERVFEHLAELRGDGQETIHDRWVSVAGEKEER